jgi:hypothetical protein
MMLVRFYQLQYKESVVIQQLFHPPRQIRSLVLLVDFLVSSADSPISPWLLLRVMGSVTSILQQLKEYGESCIRWMNTAIHLQELMLVIVAGWNNQWDEFGLFENYLNKREYSLHLLHSHLIWLR